MARVQTGPIICSGPGQHRWPILYRLTAMAPGLPLPGLPPRAHRRGRDVGEVRIAVLGGGSWGTTVASLVAHHHDTVLWARHPEVAEAINASHENPAYVPGYTLDPALTATAVLDEPCAVPTSSSWGCRRRGSAPFSRMPRRRCVPWIPVVSLSKGLERGTHLRMTEVIKEVVPGHPVAALTGPNLARRSWPARPPPR